MACHAHYHAATRAQGTKAEGTIKSLFEGSTRSGAARARRAQGTKVEGTIKSLFEGSTRSFIKCINVDYESSRSDIFLDLNVRGLKFQDRARLDRIR